MSPASKQAEPLELYLAFRSLFTAAATTPTGRASLVGKLLLLSDPSRALAATIVGGAALVAMPDAVLAKGALRAGFCNFLVNELDEAVRILKNEVRRGAAISVGLHASLQQVERSCVERGLQPDVLEQAEATLEARGARVVCWQQSLSGGESLITWSARQGGSWMTKCDALARLAIAPGGEERRRWLEQAPALLGRQHSVPMRPFETERFLAALRDEPGASACMVSVEGREIWPVSDSSRDQTAM